MPRAVGVFDNKQDKILETKTLPMTEKRERALAIARRMMQNKRETQAEVQTYYKEHPEKLAELHAYFDRLEKEKNGKSS